VSLSERAADLVKQRELRTLIIDLERVPGHCRAYDAKVKYINKAMWETPTRTICWAAKWLGEKPVEFASVWDQDDDHLAQRSWELFDEADAIITYYGKGADVPWLLAQWAKRGLGEPSTYHHFDLYATVKKLGLESNSLDYAARFLDVATKVDKYDFRVGDAAVAGDEAAQRRIRRYNIGDIHSTEALYWPLLPHIKPHPHVAPNRYFEQMCCPRCGSSDIQRCGLYRPGVYTYAEYRCSVDRGVFKAEFHHKGPSVRAL
jgi:hypothetical protein